MAMGVWLEFSALAAGKPRVFCCRDPHGALAERVLAYAERGGGAGGHLPAACASAAQRLRPA